MPLASAIDRRVPHQFEHIPLSVNLKINIATPNNAEGIAFVCYICKIISNMKTEKIISVKSGYGMLLLSFMLLMTGIENFYNLYA